MTARTLPGLGLSGFWDLGEDDWNTGMDVNLRLLSALVQGKAISMTTSLPGSPSDGDIYIVPSADTNGNDIAIRDDGSWVYLVPVEGDMIYVTDEGSLYQFDGLAWQEFTGGGGGGGATKVELSFYAEAALSDSEVIYGYVATQSFDFPAGLTGSYVKAGTAATASTVLSIKQNGTEIGTATFAAAGTTATLAMASLTSISPGDIITVVGPATHDTTLAGVYGSLLGSL